MVLTVGIPSFRGLERVHSRARRQWSEPGSSVEHWTCNQPHLVSSADGEDLPSEVWERGLICRCGLARLARWEAKANDLLCFSLWIKSQTSLNSPAHRYVHCQHKEAWTIILVGDPPGTFA